MKLARNKFAVKLPKSFAVKTTPMDAENPIGDKDKPKKVPDPEPGFSFKKGLAGIKRKS